MIRHVVMFRWSADVGAEHIAALSAALDELAGTIPMIRSYRHGVDCGLNEGNFDYVVVGDFATVDHYIAYRDHPAHQAFIQKFIVGNVESRSAVQYAID